MQQNLVCWQALPFPAALQYVGRSGYPDCVRALSNELAAVLHHCRQLSLIHKLQPTARPNTPLMNIFATNHTSHMTCSDANAHLPGMTRPCTLTGTVALDLQRPRHQPMLIYQCQELSVQR